MKSLSTKWQKFLAYLTAYLGIIPFLLAGGAILMKSEDESAKKSTKMAFLLFVPFALIDAILAIVSYFMQGGSSVSFLVDYGPLAIVQAIFAIIKLVAFVVIFILDTFTMIKFDGIINLFGGDIKSAKVVSASQHASTPAYADRVRQVKTYDTPASEEDAKEETEEK